MPRLLLKFVVWFLKTLDYFGLLPAFLTDLSPFHGTVIFTSMGSLGIRLLSTTSITSATFLSSSPLAVSTARSSSTCRASP